MQQPYNPRNAVQTMVRNNSGRGRAFSMTGVCSGEWIKRTSVRMRCDVAERWARKRGVHRAGGGVHGSSHGTRKFRTFQGIRSLRRPTCCRSCPGWRLNWESNVGIRRHVTGSEKEKKKQTRSERILLNTRNSTCRTSLDSLLNVHT